MMPGYLRIPLRTLLLVIVLISVIFGVVAGRVNAYRREQAAADRFMASGALVRFGELSNIPWYDRWIASWCGGRGRAIWLEASVMDWNAELAEPLSALSELEYLRLPWSAEYVPLRDAKFQAALRKLRSLERYHGTASAIPFLDGSPLLQLMKIQIEAADRRALDALDQIPSLVDLQIEVKFRIADFDWLRKAPSVEILDVSIGEDIPFASKLYVLSELPRLQELRFNYIADAGCQHIGRVRSLRKLRLRTDPWTPAMVASLAHCKQLREFEIDYFVTFDSDVPAQLARLPVMRRLILHDRYVPIPHDSVWALETILVDRDNLVIQVESDRLAELLGQRRNAPDAWLYEGIDPLSGLPARGPHGSPSFRH